MYMLINIELKLHDNRLLCFVLRTHIRLEAKPTSALLLQHSQILVDKYDANPTISALLITCRPSDYRGPMRTNAHRRMMTRAWPRVSPFPIPCYAV